MNNRINIEGLDKAEILCALYNQVEILDRGIGGQEARGDKENEPLTIEEARDAINKEPNIKYLDGILFNIDFSINEIDPSVYNGINGKNAAEFIIERIRRKPSQSNKISIQGLDKAKILAELYNHALTVNFGILAQMKRSSKFITDDEARSVIASNPIIDHLYGKRFKIDFSLDELDPWAYDEINGIGAAEVVIDYLRQQQKNEMLEDIQKRQSIKTISTNGSVVLLDVDDNLLITIDTEEGRKRIINTQLITQLKRYGMTDVCLFTNMDLNDIDNIGNPNRISRKDLIDKLALEGITVHQVITPADPVHDKGIGAAFREIYLTAYAKKIKNESFEAEAKEFTRLITELPVDDGYAGKKRAAGQKRSMFKYFMEKNPDITAVFYVDDDPECIKAVAELGNQPEAGIRFGSCQTRLYPINSIEEENHYSNSIVKFKKFWMFNAINNEGNFLVELKKFIEKNDTTREDILVLFNEAKKKDGDFSYIHKQENPNWDKFRLLFKRRVNQDEKNFWHTTPYQKAVKMMKDIYLTKNDKVSNARLGDEQAFIDYYRGNSPIHSMTTATRRRFR